MRCISLRLRLANVKDVVVSWPDGLLAQVIALVLRFPTHIIVQCQRTLASAGIERVGASTLVVDGAQTISRLLTKVISLAVVRVGEDAHRGADKVYSMTDFIAGTWKGGEGEKK